MKQITKFLTLLLIASIAFSCGGDKTQETKVPLKTEKISTSDGQIVYEMRLAPGPNGYTFFDTVNGYEIKYWIRDTTITVNVPYTYTKPNVDTFMRYIGTGNPPPPPPTDTTTIPPVSSTSYEGYGVDAIGGANSSTVYHVTNLSASGAGSLANGIGSNKTIVFDVSGTINARLWVSGLSYLTIDAYSSKQDITVATTAGDVLTVENSHHVIIRGIRFQHVGSDGNDCLNATGSSHDVVFDHCTAKGAYDGSIDIATANSTAAKGFTVQWCMMYGNRGSGNMLLTTLNASIHHNLFIGNKGSVPDWEERNAYAHANYSPKGTTASPNFDFRNNVIQASGRYASGNGYGAVGNYVNNYYVSNKAGLINLCADANSCGTAYVSGNFNQPTASGGTKVSTEYQIPAKYKVTTSDATTAAKAVLQNAGTYKKTPEEQSLVNAITVQ